jgi:hypothetical protein
VSTCVDLQHKCRPKRQIDQVSGEDPQRLLELTLSLIKLSTPRWTARMHRSVGRLWARGRTGGSQQSARTAVPWWESATATSFAHQRWSSWLCSAPGVRCSDPPSRWRGRPVRRSCWPRCQVGCWLSSPPSGRAPYPTCSPPHPVDGVRRRGHDDDVRLRRLAGLVDGEEQQRSTSTAAATATFVSADFRAGGSTQPRRDPGRGGRLGDVLLTWCVPAWVFLRGRSVSGFTVVRGPFCHVAINLPNHSSVSCYPAATGS